MVRDGVRFVVLVCGELRGGGLVRIVVVGVK